MAAEHATSPEIVGTDVLAFVEQLRSTGLVTCEHAGGSCGSGGGGSTARVTLTAAEFLDPVTPEAFFREDWERKALLLQRNHPGFFDRILTLADLDRHLQSRQLRAEFFRMVRRGEEIRGAQYLLSKGSSTWFVDLEKTYAL